MANVIKHKRGSGSDPVASDLVVGEVAIRTDVGKLFTKMDNGSVAEIAGGGSDIAINTLSSSSGTGGGSATFNGSAYRFTLSQPPSVSAQQLLVSINGVIQKPVAGTGQPSEGFSVDGTDIILGDAPATGSDFFILTFKSLGVSEPADNSVTSAKIVDGAIVNADINASAAIAKTKIETFVNNNGTTRLITGTNNVNELDAETNLTVNGSTITFAESTLTVSKSTLATVSAKETAGNKEIALRANTTGGVLRTIGSYPLIFEIAQAEKMRIDSSGNVGIGATSITANTNYNTLQIQGQSGSGGAILRLMTTDGSTSKAMIFADTGGLTIRQETNHPMTFSTNNTERMRIDSSGRVGIGTTSPQQELHVVGDSDACIRLTCTDGGAASIQLGDASDTVIGGITLDSSDNSIQLRGNNNAERLRIGTSGNVYIGQTSGSEQLGVSGGTNAQTLSTNSTNSNGNMVQIKCSGTTKLFLGSAGSFITGNTGTTNQGIRAEGALLFAAGGHSERMRITSDAIFAFTTTVNPGFGNNTDPGHFFADTGYAMHARNAGTALYVSRNVNTGSLVSFNYNGGGQIAEITTNGSSVSYGTGSDYRLKENITTLTNAITRLKNLKPSRFNFLKTPSITQDGFIAHEVQEVVPEAVTGVKDEVLTEDGDMGDKKGDPVMQNLDVAKIVPLLTAALQEAIGRIEVLEAK